MASLAVLFICVGNTCRSPMAEAIARALGDGDVVAASAGIMPFGRIVGATRDTLDELGYDSSDLTSKGLDDVDLGSFDVIVSLLGPAGLSGLPRTLGIDLESWSIRDPYGEDDVTYTAVARELERRIRRLLTERLDRELPIV
jgi:arsenate reductase